MSNSLRLDISLEGYRDIDKAEASFQSLLKTMNRAEAEHAQLDRAFKTFTNISQDYANAVDKLVAAKGQLIKTTAHGNSNEAKWAKTINTSVKAMREQAVAAKESLRPLDELVKLQVRADNITARQANEITKLSNRYAELTSSQASQISRLKELNSIKEAELRTDAKSHTLNLRQTQQVREQTLALSVLRTAKALEIATLKEQQKEQQRVNTTRAQAQAGTDRYSVSVRKTAEDLRYYSSSQGQAALRDQEKLKNVKQLVVEEEKRSQQMAKMARELERLKNGEESARYALEARLRAAREAARAEAKLATGTGKSSRASKEAVSQLQRHQLELKKLRETSAFYQSAQGKEILQIQRRIQSEKRLQRVMAETHIKNRFLAQSISLLSGRSLLATQATAGLRASLAGLNTSFGMYTSSTILFATAMYTLSSALRNVITSGAEFEAQMDRVTAVMDSSGGMAKYMTGEVREIARVTVFTANEVAEGLMQLGMAGLNTKDAMIALEPSLRLASIGMLDMGTTADIVTNIIVGMNLKMTNLPHVVDDMATAITNSNMTIEQLGNAMSYVAPLTRDADISVQEIIGTLEVLHNTGIKASRAGTAMRTSILSMMAPTAKAWNVLEKYNITVDDHTGKMRNWTELLGDLAAANLNLADVENLVGKRQAAAFKAMIDSMKVTERVKVGVDEYGNALYEQNTKLKESVRRLRENAGAAQIMQAVMEDNLRGDWLKLVSAIQDKFLEFYDSNADGMRDMVQSITQFISELDVGRVDEFFSSTIYWIEKLVPLMVGLKAAGMAHSVTSGAANALALIPHPAARIASGVLGAGASIAGGAAGYMAYNAVSGGIDWAKQQASPKGLDNIERRTGAYRHTYGKSADELRQMYHSYAKSLEIIEVQKAELEAEFADNGNLEEYTRKLDSLNTAAGNLTKQWQSLNEVMDASTIAPTEAVGNQAIQDIDARLAQLDEARKRLETMGKMARQDTYDSFGQFHRTKSFGVVTQQSVLSGLSSDVTARTSLVADLGWASVSNAERETYAKALQESLKSALINLDPSKVGLDEFMADIKRQIEDAPGAEFLKIKDKDAFLAGIRAYYEMQKGVMDNDSERNRLLKERSDYQDQLNQGIKTEAELQAMLYGEDAEKGIDRVKKTTEEYRKSADELYRLNDTSEQLAENQKNLLELERNIAAAYKEVTDAEAARAKDPDEKVELAASAMEQEKWTEKALKLRAEDLKLRQSLIQAAEKEAEASRSSTIALQEQVNLQRGLIAARMTEDSDFDQSRITHINSQNKLIEEQMELRKQVIGIVAADTTDKESLKLRDQQLEPLAERLKLLQKQVTLNDELYHQRVALGAMDSKDAQKSKLETMQNEAKLQELTLDYQQQGYWYTAAERAQRQVLITQQEDHLKKLRERLDTEKAIAGTLPATLTAREEEIKSVEDLIALLKNKSFYQTAEQVALENTKRIYESMYQGMESATISLLESGLKDTESFFDSLVDSFKRMLAEMAYQAAIKPIVVQAVASMMPGGATGAAGAEFMKNQGVSAGAGFNWGGVALAGAAIVAGAISSHNKRDDERMKKFTTEYVKRTNHAGTVLGNIEAQSRSISNSLTHLTDINTDLLGDIFQLTDSLKAASMGMTQLARNSMNMLQMGQIATFENTPWNQNIGDQVAGSAVVGGVGAGLGFTAGSFVGAQFSAVGGAIGGPVGAIAGALIGGVLGAFGAFGTKKTLQDAGVFIGEATVGEIAAGMFEANYYQQIRTTKKRMWVKSSSSKTVLGDDVGEQIRAAIMAVNASLTKPLVEISKSWDVLGHIDVGATIAGLTENLETETDALANTYFRLAGPRQWLAGYSYEDALADAEAYAAGGEEGVSVSGLASIFSGKHKDAKAAERDVHHTADLLKKFTGMLEGGYEGLFAEFNTNIGKITQGTGDMSFKEQQEQWDKAFSAEGDKLVEQLRDLSEPVDKLLTNWQVPADDEGEGEGAYQALMRLFAEGAHFERTMQNIGVAMAHTGIEAADLAQRYYEQAGGMEKYNEIFGAYYERFFSEEERAMNHMLQVSDVFNQLGSNAVMAGRELPQTSEAWRQLVTEVTSADPENAALILQLQQLSVSADVAQEALRNVSGELYKFDDDLRLKNVHDALDMVKRAVEAEKTAQQERYELLDAELSAREEATEEIISALKTLVASLASARQSLQVLTMDQRSQQWQKARGDVMTQAATGELPLNGELDWALNVFSSEKAATDFYDNFAQYQYEQAVTSNYLKDMEDAASEQLTTEEQMLEQIRLQREQAKRSHEAEMSRLDAIYEDAKRQVDVLLGIDTGISSIAAAIYDLQTAMMGYSVTGEDIYWAVNHVINKHGGISDAAGLELFALAKQYGVSLERVKEFLPEVAQQGMDSWLDRMGLSEIKGNDIQRFINEVLKQYGSTSDAAHAIDIETSKNDLDADRVDKFLPDPLPPAQPKQVTNDDIYWAVNHVINKHGGMGDAASLELYNLAKAHNVSLSRVKSYLPAQDQWPMEDWVARMGLPMFANGGYHSGGLRLVGEQGPELEATGPARYFSATQTASMLNQSSVVPDVSSAHDDRWVVLASEIRAARGDMNAMKREIVKELREIKEYDRKSERHLHRVVKDGVQILDDVE